MALDGVTTITRSQFYSMLERVVPRPGLPPWDALPWEPKIHLGIFVHRVEDLTPGLYLLERSTDVHERLSAALGGADEWTRPAGCPEHLALFQLYFFGTTRRTGEPCSRLSGSPSRLSARSTSGSRRSSRVRLVV